MAAEPSTASPHRSKYHGVLLFAARSIPYDVRQRVRKYVAELEAALRRLLPTRLEF